ncbi:MAG TPA: CHAT domain-containing tetratricopeptide repeat protein [Candidatus Acidoferrum sp.]|nr:CHAT domain-containing tetratricopeptide repeat protein [Candidatus Acidoferrum sp.]
MKRSYGTVLAAVGLFAGAAFGQSRLEKSEAKPEKATVVSGAGVVVENVEVNFAGERAGLEAGDVLLGWRRGNEKGEIESPFDVAEIEIEQAPRGEVTLEGLRATEKRSWVFGQDTWGIKTRPNLRGTALADYLEGLQLAKAGKLTEAGARWRSAGLHAEDSHSSTPAWLGLWFRLRAADLLASGRNWKQADIFYQEAVTQKPGASPLVTAQLQRAWGFTYSQRNDWGNAERLYQEALGETEKPDSENLMMADTISRLGLIAIKKSDLQSAGVYLARALAIREKLAPSSLAVGDSLNNLGILAISQEDFARAEDFFRKALALEETLAPRSLNVAKTLHSFGVVALWQDDLEQAESYFTRALPLRETLAPGTLELAETLNNLGVIAWRREDLAKAEDFYRKTLAIKQKLAPHTLTVSLNLYNLGLVAMSRGDLPAAQEYYRQALSINEKISPESPATAANLGGLGFVAWLGGDFAKAEGYYHRALSIYEKSLPDGLGAATILASLGRLEKDRGNLQDAEAHIRKALAITNKRAPGSHEAAVSLQNLGDILFARGAFSEAEAYYRQALAIREKLAPGSMDHAETLSALAKVARHNERNEAAAELNEQALRAIENQMTRLGGSSGSRSDFRASYLDVYSEYVDFLAEQKQPELAFRVLERSRAQTLLETLLAAHTDISKGVDTALLSQERSIRRTIAEKTNRRIELLTNGDHAEQAGALDKELAKLWNDHEELAARIKSASPAYAALTEPQPLTAKQVQEQLLDQDTLLLEYSLGQKRSYVFAVGANSLTAHELPSRAEIEGPARRVYRLLSTRNRIVQGETELQRQARIEKIDAEFAKAARELSNKILGPIAGQIRGNEKRLLIVSDGALQYIPFAALPVPNDAAHPARSTPLIADHEIVNLPSASVLAVLRRQSLGRDSAPKAVAVLADPVFEKKDYRVKATDGHTPTAGEANREGDLPSETLTRSLADLGLATNGELRLHRLPFTRKEAAAIMAVTPSGQGLLAVDFRANRGLAISQELSQYRIVHFATHGLLDSVHPELSGIVLSMVDERGRPQSGFLGLQDIYNLNLPADLVVLSACETGLGKEIQGEGLVGLTRGFMYAGASRVVASLWNVSDVATAKFMARFYAAMEHDGMRPAAALRAAQIHMWKQSRWSSPYYWAAFQIQGEWK